MKAAVTDGLGARHLLWIPGAAAVGFGTSLVFADLLRLPAFLYHPIYFGLVGGFATLYGISTRLPLRSILRRRLGLALMLGVLGGLALTWRVLADSPSAGPSGVRFMWDLAWRGVIYGGVDGLLLSTFPWLVIWRALGGEAASWPKHLGLSLFALGSALVVTSAYHAGYPDFRGPKLVQATIGNAIASLPTLLSRNPAASVATHAILHVAAVAHDPQSDLFLPPHPRAAATSDDDAQESGMKTTPIIEFPLRGAWSVFHPPGHQREAFDLLAVRNPGGSYFSKHWSRYLFTGLPVDESYSWGRTVRAPCDGIVLAARDGGPDRTDVHLIRDVLRTLLAPPRAADGDVSTLAGNHVTIRCGSHVVLLAHLRAGAVVVESGQRVRRGDPIGEVGNSGNSLVPHLHLEVMDGPDPLAARKIPFRVRRYERWVGTLWTEVIDARLVPGDVIRVERDGQPHVLQRPRTLHPHTR